MLLVTTDGRKAALDLRLHRSRLPDHPDSKVNQAVAQIERVWRDGGGVIVCFWHARLSLAPVVWEHARAQPIKGLISLSRDGEFLARAMARLGFPAIRGSSLKKTDPAKAKGGAQAFRDGLKWLKQGGALGIAPDGPRGPPEVMAEGAAMLAKASGAPVMLLGTRR